MALTGYTQPKRFEPGRPGRIHFINEDGHFVCTQRWVDASPGTTAILGNGSTGTLSDNLYVEADRLYLLDHPIMYIKAHATEAAHGTATSAFYDLRVTVIVGTMDEKIAGTGWTKVSGKNCWARVVYMDEADHLDGNFDYVQVNSVADGSGVIAYEYNY